MFKYLIDYAYKNIWCNPKQDNSLVFTPKRITNRLGVLNRFKILNRELKTPTIGVKYHIFQIGQINPETIGLIPKSPIWKIEEWVKFSDSINSLNLIVNIYNVYGVELPKFKCYYMLTAEKDLIIAIEENNKINVDYYNDQFYLRLYSNAYFQSSRSNSPDEFIHYEGKVILNTGEITDFINLYNTYNNLTGFVFCYRNGMTVDMLDNFTMHVGDVVEFIYDSSIKRVVTFTVKDLESFHSTLDNKYKYLLHYNDGLNDTIDYQNDVDIHIFGYSFTNRYEGCYYHRNSVDAHRMVTHRDYSIPVDYFTFLAEKIKMIIPSHPSNFQNYKVRVAIRDAGYYRPLVFDNNRIFELYKLNDDLALQAMVGTNSNVDEWKADNLENSAYCKVMRLDYHDVDLLSVQNALGYNAISRIVGNTPNKTLSQGDSQITTLNINLQTRSTVYEYDSNGNLLGYYYHDTGSDYVAVDNNTRLVEVISGKGSYKPNVVYGIDNLSVPSYDNYRVYKCHFNEEDNLDNIWEDITDSNEYTVTDNVLSYIGSDSSYYLMIRNDGDFLAYDIELDNLSGTFFFTLSEMADRDLGDGDLEYPLPIPLGELDIFLNGKSLIRGLDYIIDFPKVYIINKKHLVQPSLSNAQHIHVRFTGFCTSDLELDPIEDYGFIQHGFLSNNNRFDIRDDKVLRITIDGKLRHRDDVLFSEEHDGISVSNPINGLPYQIKDIVVPLKGLTNENTYSLRDKSIVIDNKISDYLTIKLPQPERNAVSSISERYALYSPFFSRILNELLNSTLVVDESIFMENLSDNKIIEICSEFEPILKFDPINPINNIDNRYVLIHPNISGSMVSLDVYKYNFLMKVVKLYGNNLIELSPFVSISA